MEQLILIEDIFGIIYTKIKSCSWFNQHESKIFTRYYPKVITN